MERANSGLALAGGRSRARLLHVGVSRREHAGIWRRILGEWKNAKGCKGNLLGLFKLLPLGVLVVSAIANASHHLFALPFRCSTSDPEGLDRPAGDGPPAAD